MRRLLAPGLIGLAALVGCGSSPSQPPASAPELPASTPESAASTAEPARVAASSPSPAGHGSLSRIYAALASSGTDYQPATSTLALAQRSGLVAEGVATGVRPGRTIGDPDLGLPPRTTVLLEVAVDRTHRGPQQQRVMVELPGEGLTAVQFAAALPDRMRVVVYAKPAAPPDVGEQVVATSPQWRSAGRVWQPVNPQGLLFGYSARVIAPLDDREFPGVGITAFRPSAKPYPTGRPAA